MATAVEQPVTLPVDGGAIEGNLLIPTSAAGIVVFAHGSGSSRHSPRNRFVAESLHSRNLGTFLIDLLTREEERIDDRTRHLRFDIDLLAGRLRDTADWLAAHPQTRDYPIGYFGASTGAAAALVAAAQGAQQVAAIVSRGGRPDLAGPAIERVSTPTLLIVGGADQAVIEFNRQAYARLRVEKRIEIVPGATHLFEEPGALEQVARLAGDWFAGHMVRTAG